ncbi:glycine--tRNA ligase subunit beta [Stenotrophomonas sp. W1S232]|uniref:Glycine--tRNA ligase beta subunit n=1 Tax=Stenotrophomonas koreensis TaxID=266128 RepID=A0A7W3UYF7_9GAMM|nr:glycine--tRNA ligase subunit beta [Stenotrophomonas koreensis]MBB1116036.1 glycine--tRNA ligase subunit beta [Stenotrophomonas koreensis]
MSIKPLLIELGVEELPVKALPGLSQAFFDGIVGGLEKRGVSVERGNAKPLSTPRRLAVLLPGVGTEQPEQHSEVLGPYLNIGLDADGNPTKALAGFAAKAGLDWTQLERTSDAKGERFVARTRKPGAATAELIPEILAETIAAMPIPKPMRWGAHAHAFARPVHWLVVLHGKDIVPVQLLGLTSDRFSRGHRFMHDKQVWISDAAEYVEALAGAKVLVDAELRRERILAQVSETATAAGGVARISEDNLAQVVHLCEWPAPVLCRFEREFLAVPQEALIETMEINQKFFPVLDGEGRLTEQFIGIANIESRDVAEVAKGYERVIRPRFSDAKFFFDEDLKQGLEAMGAGLSSVTYQAKLGTVADKVARVAALAAVIAPQVGVDAGQATRAAQLAKNDLQSYMVGEFPELQGIAGRHYAVAAGEDAAVALAIDEAYQPRFAADDIAASALGKVLAIAERLDTLAGGFAAGLKPTGNKDPFALRRNALGLARTLIESGFDLDLGALLAAANAGLADKGVQADVAELADFIIDRLKGYYADRGVPTSQFNAVAERKPASLYDFDRRIDAIGIFAALPEAAALAAANKRIGNILRKAEDVVIPDSVDAALLAEPAESALAEAVAAAIAQTTPALESKDYVAVLTRLAGLRPQVDAFFDGVMVNAEAPALRANRLALLKQLGGRLGAVAAIEHLSS